MNTWPSTVALLRVLLCTSLVAACSGLTVGSPASSEPIPRVGLMHVGTDHNPPSLATLVAGLGAVGWFDGPASQVTQQLVGDGTIAQGRMKQLQGQFVGPRIELIWRNLEKDQADEQAKEFVRERVDLIVAFEDKSISAAQAATADPANRIPVVFLHPSDPVRQHLVESLAHPGGNLTGVWGARDPIAKQLEIYRQILPGPQPLRLLTLEDPTDPATALLVPEALDAASKLGIALHRVQVADDAALAAAFASLTPGEVDGAFILSPSLRLNSSGRIIGQPDQPGLAAQANLPVQAHRKEWVDPKQHPRGALFSLGVDVGPVGTAGARFVDSILKGTRPADLPAQEVPKVEFALSVQRATELGIKVPPDVRAQANPLYP